MISDEELFGLMREKMHTAVVGDVLDAMGLLNQYLPAEIQPLRNDMMAVGRAMTVLEEDRAEGEPGAPFGKMLEALDSLRPGEVYVCTGGSLGYALWGELMSTRAMRLGSGGAVLDGYSRDTRGILTLGFPTFSRGRYGRDQRPRGRVADYRVTVEIGGVTVRPGDLVFGDADGVVVVPREAEEETIRRAMEKLEKEDFVREALEGKSSAADAVAKYGTM